MRDLNPDFFPRDMPVLTFAIIAITGLVSLIGFSSAAFRDRLIFCPEWILRRKQYYRVVTSALLHADALHLIFNMLTLYLFGRLLEFEVGKEHFLLIYAAGIVGGSLVSLFIHRDDDYRALGASGGTCGIVFAGIFLFPDMRVALLFFPVPFPAWAYAIFFLMVEFFGIRSQRSNIGHDAHVGGAIIGLLTTTALYPDIVRANPKLYATVMGLAVWIFVYLLQKPVRDVSGVKRIEPVPDPEPERPPTTEEVEAILDKISRRGLRSLSEKEQRIMKGLGGLGDGAADRSA